MLRTRAKFCLGVWCEEEEELALFLADNNQQPTSKTLGRLGSKSGIMKRKIKPARERTTREFFTIAELSNTLNLNEMTIYRLVKSGQLPGLQFGRVVRLRRYDVEDFLNQRESVPREIRKH